MGLIWKLIEAVLTGSENDKKSKLEKEMDYNGLEDWQKYLVRKGDYEPHNFEESGDLDEDDYYYEDND